MKIHSLSSLLLAFGLGLMGCTSVPITSYPKLASANPETMEMSEVELAVRIQDDFKVRPETALLFLGLRHKETGEEISETFIFTEGDAELTPVLEGKQKEGFRIHKFYLDPETAAAAQSFRDKMFAIREQEPNAHEGTMTASTGLCLTEGGNPFLDPRMTLFLRLNSSEDFFTLFKETKTPIDDEMRDKFTDCEA